MAKRGSLGPREGVGWWLISYPPQVQGFAGYGFCPLDTRAFARTSYRRLDEAQPPPSRVGCGLMNNSRGLYTEA